MSEYVSRRIALALGAFFISTTFALAQPAKSFEPREGQEGKDVIWLPTHSDLVNRMLDMAQVKSTDTVIDLGSGDGRTVIAAAMRGAQALGIEYNPDMVALSQRRAQQAGITAKARFVRADIFESDFSNATVITMFLLPNLNIRLRPKLLELKPGTRIVSNSFDMGEWRPDQTIDVEGGCLNHCEAYLWIVPANFAGTWKTTDGTLTLKQSFQEVTGTLDSGNVAAPISEGKVRGETLSFKAGGKHYSVKMGADGLEGTQSVETPFRATR